MKRDTKINNAYFMSVKVKAKDMRRNACLSGNS